MLDSQCSLSQRITAENSETGNEKNNLWSNLGHMSASAALAEGSRADCIQTISPGVQVSTRVRTRIPYCRAFVTWQMSRLVSNSVPVHLHH